MQELFEFNGKMLDSVLKYRTERLAAAPSVVSLKRIGINDREMFDRRLGSALYIVIYMALKKGNLDVQKRELADFFNVNTPAKLWFPREPDKYYMAVQSGDLSFDESQGYTIATATMVVPDGLAHSLNPRYFSNVIADPAATNMVLDSNFVKRNKYWKPWAKLLNEKYSGSNILRGDFTEDSAAANDIAAGNWFQVNGSTTRLLPNLKVGDAVSFAAAFRIITAQPGDTTGANSVKLILEERSWTGGDLLKRHIVTPTALNLGQWQLLKAVNIKITNPKTRALNLALGVYGGACADISRPQFNLGSTLAPYAIASTSLTDELVVSNSGTYRAAPIFRCRMNGENGLIGLVNSDGGVLQFGNPEELDTIAGKRSDKVVDINMRNSGSKFTLNTGASTYPNYLSDPATPNKVQGSIDWAKDPDAATPYFTNGDVNVWGGPKLHADIPLNYANENTGDFEFKNRITFDTNAKRRGRFELLVQNGDSVAFSMVVRDSTSSDEIVIEGWCQKKYLFWQTLKRKDFRGYFFETCITRTGSKIEYRFSPIDKLSGEKVTSKKPFIKTLTVPQAKNLPVTSLTGWFQRFGNTNHTLMSWTDCKFTWINTPITKDIINRFSDGDMVEIHVAGPTIMINGVENTTLHALGNEWDKFWIEPGNETIQLIASSWASMYECEIELEEAYV